MQKHCKIKVFGEVQDVSFRYYTKELTEKLGVFGFCRNEDDGTFYIEAEAEESVLKELIEWCHKGPEYAKVSDVRVEYSDELKGFKDFVIER